jgi:phospholipase C
MRSRGQGLRTTLGVAVVVAFGAAAGAVLATPGSETHRAATTLTPVADAYVRADRPAASFGRAPSLRVSRRPAAIAFLRFRVAVPAGRTVSRAALQLFASSGSASGFTVHAVPSTTWAESTLTYASAPRVRSRAAASSGAYRGRAYVSVDVTPLVTRGGLVSLALEGVGRAPLEFRSREAGAGRPRLLVETSGPAPAPPIGGSPGAGAVAAGGGGGADAGGGSGGGGGAAGAAATCGTAAARGEVEHVIWIWMENKSYDSVIGSPSAPFGNALAAACGLATSYHAVAHPSLPNYVAATSGSTQGIADDDPPATHPVDAPSIYGLLAAAGRTWRDYEESAPGNCPLVSSGLYAVRHDPAAYYTAVRADCALWDVPLGTTAGGAFLSDLSAGTLPAFSFVTPDLCNDTHDCSVATGDAWLEAWLGKIVASPSYQAGGTVVFVTWDEDDGSASNRVPLIVVSPSTPAGTRVGTSFDHYSLLKTTEQLLGLAPLLGHAADPGTASMVSAFDLG